MHNYPVLKDKEILCSSITIWTILKSLFLAKISGALKRKEKEKNHQEHLLCDGKDGRNLPGPYVCGPGAAGGCPVPSR